MKDTLDSHSNSGVARFGYHYMLDGYGAPEGLLNDRQALQSLLEQLPQELGMHLIADPVVVEVGPKNRKDPGGLSGFALVAESHISFHTFPKRGFVTIDIYTCGDYVDSDHFTRKFTEVFRLKHVDEHELTPRGLNYPSDNIS